MSDAAAKKSDLWRLFVALGDPPVGEVQQAVREGDKKRERGGGLLLSASGWFKAFRKAEEMCGGSTDRRRVLPKDEVRYLDALVRGVYAKRDLDVGYEFNSATFSEDFYLAIPLRKGQLSCREILNGQKLTEPIKTTEPLTIEHVDGPYSESDHLRQFILDRGY